MRYVHKTNAVSKEVYRETGRDTGSTTAECPRCRKRFATWAEMLKHKRDCKKG